MQDQILLTEYQIDCDQLFKPKGCEACGNLGFSGRVGIFELLEINDNLRELIIKHPRLDDIYQSGINSGMLPLKHDAVSKLKTGVTSLTEILRVIR